MRPARSSSNVTLVLALGFAAFAAASAVTSHGNVFYVGAKDGWVSKPAESYHRWAARHQFKVTDALVFKYKKGQDAVLAVDRSHYDACNTKDPIDELHDGHSTYVLDRTGTFYFINGDAGRCKKGQKLMVVVTVEMIEPHPGSQAPSPSPTLPPSTSIAVSPNYYHEAQPSLAPAHFVGPSESHVLSPTSPPIQHSYASSPTLGPAYLTSLSQVPLMSPSVPPMLAQSRSYPHHPPMNAALLAPSPLDYTTSIPSLTHKSSQPPSFSELPHDEHLKPPSITLLSPKPQPHTSSPSPSPTTTISFPPTSKYRTKTSLSRSPSQPPNTQLHTPCPILSPSHSFSSQQNSTRNSSIAPSPKVKPASQVANSSTSQPPTYYHAPSLSPEPQTLWIAPAPSHTLPPQPSPKQQTPTISPTHSLSHSHPPSPPSRGTHSPPSSDHPSLALEPHGDQPQDTPSVLDQELYHGAVRDNLL